MRRAKKYSHGETSENSYTGNFPEDNKLFYPYRTRVLAFVEIWLSSALRTWIWNKRDISQLYPESAGSLSRLPRIPIALLIKYFFFLFSD